MCVVPSVLWRCWLGDRKGVRPVKNSGGVLVWLSVWNKVQTCWCRCHSLSLVSVKARLVLPFWYRFTWVVPEKGPLNGCVCVCVVYAGEMGPHDTALEREHFGRSDDQTVPHRRSKMPPAYQHCLLSMHCAEQGLCNGQASVCMSVCPVIRPLHSAAAGLPLCARRQEISFDCCTAGAQQQRRHSGSN